MKESFQLRLSVVGVLLFVIVCAAEFRTSFHTQLTAEQRVAQQANVTKHLLEVSTTVITDEGMGSGVCFSRKLPDGNYVTFVWTAAHVVEDTIKTDPGADVKVMRTISEDGRIIGQTTIDAEVVRIGDSQHDLALLRVRQKNYTRESVSFYTGPTLQSGTPLYHVGSFYGSQLANSFSTGVFSTAGRVFPDHSVLDQVTVCIVPGSSGGGVYLEDGQLVGIATRAASMGTIGFMVPTRQLLEWAKAMKVEYAVSETIPLPEPSAPPE